MVEGGEVLGELLNVHPFPGGLGRSRSRSLDDRRGHLAGAKVGKVAHGHSPVAARAIPCSQPHNPTASHPNQAQTLGTMLKDCANCLWSSYDHRMILA